MVAPSDLAGLVDYLIEAQIDNRADYYHGWWLLELGGIFMSEFQNELGEITIDDEVLISIIQRIISETEGIAQFGGNKVLGKWGGKGIKIERDEKGR